MKLRRLLKEVKDSIDDNDLVSDELSTLKKKMRDKNLPFNWKIKQDKDGYFLSAKDIDKSDDFNHEWSIDYKLYSLYNAQTLILIVNNIPGHNTLQLKLICNNDTLDENLAELNSTLITLGNYLSSYTENQNTFMKILNNKKIMRI